MAPQPKPWRRGKGAWYAQVDRVKTWLAPKDATKTQAQAELRRILAEGKGSRASPTRTRGLTSGEVMRIYSGGYREGVDRGERSADAYEVVDWFLTKAIATFGRIPASAIKPADVLAWATRPEWGQSSRRTAIRTVKAAFSHAKALGHVPVNMLADMKAPRGMRREKIPTAAQVQAIIAAAPAEFRDYLIALIETGCRPGEVRTLTAAMIDLEAGTWKIPNKTRGKTGEQLRTIYLTEKALELSGRLSTLRPSGPIFRNQRGRPWTRTAIAWNMRRLRGIAGAGKEAVAYALRHRFATDALVNGVPVATVATLLGHTSTAMVMRNYSALPSEMEHLRRAAAQARGGGGMRDELGEGAGKSTDDDSS